MKVRNQVTRSALLVLALSLLTLRAADVPAYLDPNQSIDRRVNDLLSRMTLEEKLGQMNMPCVYLPELGHDIPGKMLGCKRFIEGTHANGIGPGGGLFTAANEMLQEGPRQQALYFNELQRIAADRTRLKIPVLQTEEGTHGVQASGHTVFPEGPGLGSSWNVDLIREVYAAAAREARSVGIHQLFTLVIEPNRDPRLGRNEETFSEDPYLCSRFAEAIVRGAQGDDVSASDKVVAGLCHFPGQSQAAGGLEWGAMDVSERVLREVFLPPWVVGIRQAGALGVMATYPAIDGIPSHVSERLLTGILRDELGFRGLVLGEGGGISTSLVEHVAATQKEAGELALKAGVDVGISYEDGFMGGMIENVRMGRVTMAMIDRAVARILRQKFTLGLFEKPLVDPERAVQIVHNQVHQKLALKAAREGIVLLKNEGNLLPFRNDLKTIAVIGPNADNPRSQLGDYTAFRVSQPVVTVLEGVKRAVPPGVRVLYERGCEVLGADRSGFERAIQAAKAADVVIVVVGENERYSPNGGTDGETLDVASLDLTGVQEDLVQAVHTAGKPTVVVLINGRPLSVRWPAEHVPAIVEAWLPGEQGGTAVADVIFGHYNPSGRLSVTVPRHVGQLPMFYNQKPSRVRWDKGRPQFKDYVDMKGGPLYPFGHGLSYTTFAYANLRIEPGVIPPAGGVRIAVDVANTGNRAGEEVVQLYLNDVVTSVTRPLEELKGFRKISLQPGERKTVEFRLGADELSYLDRNLRRVVEPGEFRIMIGRSSEDLRLSGSFRVAQ